MSDNVAHLRPLTVPVAVVDQEVIALLESLLAHAKAGEFNGIAVATVQLAGAGQAINVGSAYAGEGILQARHTALGAAEALKQRIGRNLIEGW